MDARDLRVLDLGFAPRVWAWLENGIIRCFMKVLEVEMDCVFDFLLVRDLVDGIHANGDGFSEL